MVINSLLNFPLHSIHGSAVHDKASSTYNGNYTDPSSVLKHIYIPASRSRLVQCLQRIGENTELQIEEA